ncbi:MAG TPA: MarR family transcriptional regulator [Microthrixaceae bacterium]|jgi:DNA-binding MarR family transcriptional regulator|nr:MarR family transcriptional regulator [Microthrixaceae bacterium]HMT23913.1 MarR family transcriptional regulator [Microthrixaceae bacterium]
MSSHVGYLTIRLAGLAKESFERAIEPLGLRPALYDVLAVVAELGPESQRDLAAVLGIDPARVVALVDELESSGLAERRVDPDDRRRRVVAPTRRGRDVHGRALRAARLVEADLLDALTPAERTVLRDLLRRTIA